MNPQIESKEVLDVLENVKNGNNIFKDRLLPEHFEYFKKQLLTRLRGSISNLFNKSIFDSEVAKVNNDYENITYLAIKKKKDDGTIPSSNIFLKEKEQLLDHIARLHEYFVSYINYSLIFNSTSLYLYNDFSCCGINHFGHIYTRDYGLNYDRQMLDNVTKEIDDMLLTRFIEASNDHNSLNALSYIKIQNYSEGYTPTKEKFLETYKVDVLREKKDTGLCIKSTAALTDNTQRRINEFIKCKPNDTKMLTQQEVLYYILQTSKSFELQNKFTNLNSGNTIYEFETKFTYNDLVTGIIDILEND